MVGKFWGKGDNNLKAKTGTIGFGLTVVTATVALANSSSDRLNEYYGSFQYLNNFEKYYLTTDRSYWNAIQDEGGLSGSFFGLGISNVMTEGDNTFVITIEAPSSIRPWGERLCGIASSGWDIKRRGSFTSGNAKGSDCEIAYQPWDDTVWMVTIGRFQDDITGYLAGTQQAAGTAVQGSTGSVPALDVAKAQEYCSDEWTKRGVLDKNMFDYCMERQREGYNEALDLYARYSSGADSIPEINQLLAYADEEWGSGRRGEYQFNMVAHEFERQIEGYLDVKYLIDTGKVSDSKLSSCKEKWLRSEPNWNMVAYCIEK